MSVVNALVVSSDSRRLIEPLLGQSADNVLVQMSFIVVEKDGVTISPLVGVSPMFVQTDDLTEKGFAFTDYGAMLYRVKTADEAENVTITVMDRNTGNKLFEKTLSISTLTTSLSGQILTPNE